VSVTGAGVAAGGLGTTLVGGGELAGAVIVGVEVGDVAPQAATITAMTRVASPDATGPTERR
jgi:hypothetical protein